MKDHTGQELAEVFGQVLTQTDMAIYVQFADKKHWLPKSVIEDWPDVGQDGDILMPIWLAKQRDLI